jgi:uncharacterized protein involved in response to NO
MQVQINDPGNSNPQKFALFNLGFRAFFLGAAIFSVASIALWSAIFLFQFSLPMHSISSAQWHAHEMIYGYGIAVIAGFLLTAVKNWTGVQTLHGKGLVLLFSLWAIARILMLGGTSMLFASAVFDLLFSLFLLFAIAHPIIKVAQWKQLIILLVIFLLFIGNTLFYLGAFNIFTSGIHLGLYSGLYLIIAMILIMGRRVIPFFIEKGVDDEVELKNYKWVDSATPVFFTGFVIAELYNSPPLFLAGLATILFFLTAIRLYGWHSRGIWKKCLLWSLYLSFCFIALAFALIASSYLLGTAKSLAIHAFTFGGIGVITMGMMSRVALGHTGRDIKNPPKLVAIALGILIAGAVIRVLFPLVETDNYMIWVGISQLCWIIAFLTFLISYFPVLCKPRTDGLPG